MSLIERSKVGPLGAEEIHAFLPHRDPFLFVDRIDEVVVAKDASGNPTPLGTIARGRKRFTAEMDFFRGHFPGYPITPGVIVTEAAGQVGCFVFYPFMRVPKLLGGDGEPLKLAGVNSARYRRPVLPGDEIETEAILKRGKKTIWIIECTVRSKGELVADLELIANFDLKIDI